MAVAARHAQRDRPRTRRAWGRRGLPTDAGPGDGGRPEADRDLHAHCPTARSRGTELTTRSAIMKQPHKMRPGNRYARQGQAGRTLGDLIASKSALVAICQRCKHRRLLYPPVLASRLGENFPGRRRAAPPALRGMQPPWRGQGLRVLPLSPTETVPPATSSDFLLHASTRADQIFTQN